MPDELIFPMNPFDDVNPSDFNKLNKKHVTEDFVGENFKKLGWEVFSPFNDTGIDRIVTKRICPKGHTGLSDKIGINCPECKSKSIEIIRFLQVKTRSLKNGVFGFTLKSKDIRVDPRHVFVLYSDKTTDNKQDFLIISVKDYLSFFEKNNMNPFSGFDFRKGNAKLNSLKYKSNEDKWYWQKYSWESYRNLDGLKKIQDPAIDLKLAIEISETRKLANKLLNRFSKGRTFTQDLENKVNSQLGLKLNITKEERVSKQKIVDDYLKEHCSQEVLDSMHKYFENVKLAESQGGNDE